MKRNQVLYALVGIALAACSGKSDAPAAGKGTGTGGGEPKPTAVAELAAPPLGVTSLDAWNYPYGKGEKPFAHAADLRKAKDWAGLAAACEATVAADGQHLDAQWLWGVALAGQGKPEAAVTHLAIALAGDYLRWGGPDLEKDAELAAFFATPDGARLKALNLKLREQFVGIVLKNVPVVGRRTSFRAPGKAGTLSGSTRAELFAYDHEANRYLRLTHTGFQVAGFLFSPTGDALVYVTWSKVSLSDKPEVAPLLVEAHVGVVPRGSPWMATKEAVFKDARALRVAYDVGDKLTVTTFAADGRWALKDPKTFAVGQDAELKPSRPPAAPNPVLTVTYDDVVLERGGPVENVEADFRPQTDAASSFRLTTTQKTVTLPSGESAVRSSFMWSPKKTLLAFATAGDPCATKDEERQSSLYLVDAATAKIKHVETGLSGFAARWVNEDTLLYDDDKGGVRVYSVPDLRGVAARTARGGVSLVGVGALPFGTRVCKAKPGPTSAPATGPEEPEGQMPPEEPARPQ